jgi:hypothetical protein
MTVGRMMEEMSGEELTYWQAWSALETEDYEAEKNKTANVGKVTKARRR